VKKLAFIQTILLRPVINAIIDIRLQRTDWPEEDAVRLMTEQGFQKEGEAQSKLVRAKLGAVQLASYFSGQLDIENLLAEKTRAARPNLQLEGVQRAPGERRIAGSPDRRIAAVFYPPQIPAANPGTGGERLSRAALSAEGAGSTLGRRGRG
jgi:hypothetical protein